MTDPILIKFPKGLDNRNREYALPEGTARTLENVDVTRDGGLMARKGLRAVSASDCHSLFAPSTRFLLLVKAGVLTRMDQGEQFTALTAVSGPVQYALLNDETYWTDGTAVGRITATGESTFWGLSTPPAPVCSTVSSGGLHAGTYQVAMTAVHTVSGLESGAGECVEVVVAADGGIQVTVPSASGVNFAVYLTPPNGEQGELRQAALLAPGGTTTLGRDATLGKPLDSLFATKPLPGQCLVAHKGRLWCASGTVIWFTSEKSPHWLFPDNNYFYFEAPVTLLSAAEDGLYVGTAHSVYFLQGSDPAKMTQRLVAAEGAARYSQTELPYDLFLGQGSFPTRQCAWWTVNGQLAIGKPGGIVLYPTQDRFSAGATTTGVLAYRDYAGLRQLIAALDTQINSTQAIDTAIIEVFSQEIILGEIFSAESGLAFIPITGLGQISAESGLVFPPITGFGQT